MSDSRGKKKLIVIIISIVGVLGILAAVYFFNKDSIDRWFRLKMMSDEEYIEMVSDELVGILKDSAFAPVKYAPDISNGATFDLSVSLDESIASAIGLQGNLRATVDGNAYMKNGILSARLDPCLYGENNEQVELTIVDTTLDLPQKRVFVRMPRFDEGTLELTSLYKNRLDSVLSSISSIVDVEGIVKNISGIFGDSIGRDSIYENIRSLRRTTELKKEEMFWGIGVKEGKDCSIVESFYDIEGLELRVRIFADESGNVIGFSLRFDTGKNRLEAVFDIRKKSGSEDGKILFDAAYEISLDGLKLLNGDFVTKSGDGENAVSQIGVAPGKLLSSILGEKDISLKISVSAENSTEMRIDTDLNMGNGNTSNAYIVLRGLEGNKPEVLGSGEVTDISTLNILDYGNTGELVEFLVNKVEKLDIQLLRDYIDKYIKEYVNPSAGYDLLKEFNDTGMLSLVINVLTGDGVSKSQTNEEAAGATGPDEKEEAAGVTPADEKGEAAGATGADEKEEAAGATGPDEKEEATGTSPADEKEKAAGATGPDEKEKTEGTPPVDEKETSGVSSADNPPKKTYTPEEIEKLKADFLRQYKYSYPIETDDPKADWGDEIVMDIVPILLGRPYTEAEYKGAYAYLGEQWYGEGLDEKVIGAAVGDEIEVEATLGEEFGAFSGFSGKFKVTITEIHKYVRPEWNESFIVDRLGFESLEACEKKLLGELD
ncbi:MAG: hypothetical protein K6F93_02005 [Lachnospiraceae bacterium]|nr:hypothetical protein [Lachnospiraceae bacterium]